jgi:hypothetical protein
MVNTMSKDSPHIDKGGGMGFLQPVTRSCITGFDVLFQQHATQEFRKWAGGGTADAGGGNGGVYRVDLLQIDIECQDYKILQLVDFAKFRPEHIQYEALDCMGDGIAKAADLLRRNGYEVFPPQPDDPDKDVYARLKT